MDPQVARRMVMDIKWWHCNGKVDGDKQFDINPVILKGYSYGKDGVVLNGSGEEVKTKTVVYLNGTEADKLGPDDEIQVPFGMRMPIKYIQPLPSLGIGWELVEVRL